MHVSRKILGLAAGMLAALAVQAQAPAGAPSGSTGLCKDGSYYSGATKQGACRGHKGVKDWYGASTASAPAASARTAKPAAAAASAAVASGPAPSGATGQCKDGSYYSGATKKGACRGHKGVKDWYGAAPAAAPAAAAAPAPRAAAPAAAPTPAAPAAAPVAAAPGGGPGQVWVNTKSKVYHCQSDSLYGRTKEGAYMSEAAATAAGDRPARGKACH